MENYKILICDDEKNIVDSISNEIIKYYKRRNIKVDLFPFIDGKDASIFLNEKIVDAVFLDIEIDKISGIQLAKQVREKSIETQIIFITGHEKYQKYVFSFHVFDYIMKPILL
ncbi:MAG: response regulator [Erysipelotrichales bacterium]|nr:response regulator [Erysipelotrichales bacterium]